MKYANWNYKIPTDKRKELNEKALYLVDCGLSGASQILPEDIFNAYTGDGGLHGLDSGSYDNYHEYSAAKKEVENGQFFTPPPLCEFIISCL